MILILKSRWNESITGKLSEAAENYLRDRNFEVESIAVPGALEFPLAAAWFAEKYKDRLKGVVLCGTIIRGDTYHFDLVANESHRALMELSLAWKIPFGFAILACNTTEQAIERSSGKSNKGIEAAQAVVEMLELKRAKEL